MQTVRLLINYQLAIYELNRAQTQGKWRKRKWQRWKNWLFPKSLTAIYPIAYNYSFLLAEAAITLVIICIPAVAKGLGKVKQIAAE